MPGYNFKKHIAFFCLTNFFTFTNSVDPDEMQHYAAFHLGLHCLQKYLFRVSVNPLHYDRLSIYYDNKYGIVHFVIQRVAGQTFYKIMFFCP